MTAFNPLCLPLLIGSLPIDSHDQAVDLVFSHTPEIPLWVQLPAFRHEGMINQFIEGLPGFDASEDRSILNAAAPDFDEQMLLFFQDYLTLSEDPSGLTGSRFSLNGPRGKGFERFLKAVDDSGRTFTALKGQVSGPISFGTAVKDENDKDIFYNDQLRDAAIKKLALNARWQAMEFARRGALPIVFIDEPALAGFGTSAYITITREDVIDALEEIASQIHAENGLAGVHVCANTQWDMLLDSSIDIISFDAFSYFDRFILYPDKIRAFLEKGGILAQGIVPTAKASVIAGQSVDSLSAIFRGQVDELAGKTGLTPEKIMERIFITPSCGTGSIDVNSAVRVLELTRDLSALIRKDNA